MTWSSLRGVLTGIAVSVPITIVGALIGLPLVFSFLLPPSLGPLGFIGAVAAVPFICNLFVWRAYMSRSSRATQVSPIVTGAILSIAFAVLFLIGLFLSIMSGG